MTRPTRFCCRWRNARSSLICLKPLLVRVRQRTGAAVHNFMTIPLVKVRQLTGAPVQYLMAIPLVRVRQRMGARTQDFTAIPLVWGRRLTGAGMQDFMIIPIALQMLKERAQAVPLTIKIVLIVRGLTAPQGRPNKAAALGKLAEKI